MRGNDQVGVWDYMQSVYKAMTYNILVSYPLKCYITMWACGYLLHFICILNGMGVAIFYRFQ